MKQNKRNERPQRRSETIVGVIYKGQIIDEFIVDERAERLKSDYNRAKRMCGCIMPENCNYFMFSQFHITLMCWYTGRDDEKRLQHMAMAQYYNMKMEENNKKYGTNWY